MKLKYSKFNKVEIVNKSDKVFIPPPPRKKTILETIMAPWRPLPVLDAEPTSISNPSIPGPPEVMHVRIHKQVAPVVAVVAPVVRPVKVKAPKPIHIVKQEKAPMAVEVVPNVVPGPEPGSRAWKKQQFKLTNFI